MKIVLFGTGSGLRDILSILPEAVEIVGLCDNNPRKQGTSFAGHTIYSPASILELSFDFVVITTRTGEAIRAQLLDMGVEREQILLFYPSFDQSLRLMINHDVESLNRNLGLGLHPLSLCTMQLWRESKLDIPSSEDDFCRTMSMRLAAERINRKKVPGAIAELGVYQGEFSALLSRLFPERKLYLFDTFEGFSDKDLADGKEEKHSKAEVGDFEDTDVGLVLARIAGPERVVVRKGYFPATAEGLDDTFALVSLDVDLYKPTIAGLHYFYPRLSQGGCIFIHDYNNSRYNGVRSAVEEFSEATNAPLVQLPDFAGTAILSK